MNCPTNDSGVKYPNPVIIIEDITGFHVFNEFNKISVIVKRDAFKNKDAIYMI